LSGLFDDVLHQREHDAHASPLRLHKLKGGHKDKHAVALTYSHRMVLLFRLKRDEIVLLDVGFHEEV